MSSCTAPPCRRRSTSLTASVAATAPTNGAPTALPASSVTPQRSSAPLVEHALVCGTVLDLIVGLRAAPDLRRRPRCRQAYAGGSRGSPGGRGRAPPPPRSRSRPDRAPGVRAPLSRPHSATAGSSSLAPERCVEQALVNRGRKAAAFGPRGHGAGLLCRSAWRRVRIEVLSVEGVMMSMSCRTRLSRAGRAIGQKPERPEIGLAEMAKADQPQPRRQERRAPARRRCAKPVARGAGFHSDRPTDRRPATPTWPETKRKASLTASAAASIGASGMTGAGTGAASAVRRNDPAAPAGEQRHGRETARAARHGAPPISITGVPAAGSADAAAERDDRFGERCAERKRRRQRCVGQRATRDAAQKHAPRERDGGQERGLVMPDRARPRRRCAARGGIRRRAPRPRRCWRRRRYRAPA